MGCPVCLDAFEADGSLRPLLLDCGHSCCDGCLVKIASPVCDLKCPVCRKVTAVPAAGRDSPTRHLKPNYALIDDIPDKKRAKSKPVKEDSKMPDPDAAEKKHAVKKGQVMCTTHKDRPVELYCSMDAQLNHKVQLLSDAVKTVRTQCSRAVADHVQRLQDAHQSMKRRAKEAATDCERTQRELTAAATNLKIAVSAFVDDRLRSLQAELSAHGEHSRTATKALQEEVERLMEEVSPLVEEWTALSGEEDATALQHAASILDRLQVPQLDMEQCAAVQCAAVPVDSDRSRPQLRFDGRLTDVVRSLVRQWGELSLPQRLPLPKAVHVSREEEKKAKQEEKKQKAKTVLRVTAHELEEFPPLSRNVDSKEPRTPSPTFSSISLNSNNNNSNSNNNNSKTVTVTARSVSVTPRSAPAAAAAAASTVPPSKPSLFVPMSFMKGLGVRQEKKEKLILETFSALGVVDSVVPINDNVKVSFKAWTDMATRKRVLEDNSEGADRSLNLPFDINGVERCFRFKKFVEENTRGRLV